MEPLGTVVHVLPSWPQRGGVGDVVRALVDVEQRSGRRSPVVSDGGSRVPGAGIRRQLGPHLSSADAVVLHGVFTPALARTAGWLQRTAPRVRVVAFPHDAYDEALLSSRRLLKDVYFRLVERDYLRAADVVVVTAPRHVADLRARRVNTPAVVVPLGVEPVPAPPPRGAEPLRALVLGRWDVWDKGLDLLAEALRGAPELSRRVRLRLVGPESGARDEVAALFHGTAVDLVGWAPDVAAELVAADLLLAPSRKEGFCLVALQALAAGRPVLLSGEAGLGDYVGRGDGAVVVRPSADAVQDGIRELLDRYEQLTSGAQRFARDRAGEFSWARVVDAVRRPLPAEPDVGVDA